MRSADKINGIPSLRRLKGLLWMSYFMLILSLVGAILAYGVVVPLACLGFFIPQARRRSEKVMVKGIAFLMKIQPWYESKMALARVKGPVLLVSNHRSHLDAFILLSQVEGIKIVAKRSLFFIPGLGLIMWVSRQIPVKSKAIDSLIGAMHTVRNRLKNGEVVHVFPEMTRCFLGEKGVQKFSLAPFQVAFQEGVSILPIVFKNTDVVWSKGTMSLNTAKNVEAFSLPHLNPKDFLSVQELRDEVHRQITRALL